MHRNTLLNYQCDFLDTSVSQKNYLVIILSIIENIGSQTFALKISNKILKAEIPRELLFMWVISIAIYHWKLKQKKLILIH